MRDLLLGWLLRGHCETRLLDGIVFAYCHNHNLWINDMEAETARKALSQLPGEEKP